MFKGHYPSKQEKTLQVDILKNNLWLDKGYLIKQPKRLALGRSCYYIYFIEWLQQKNNKQYFQSDFMTWPDPIDYKKSLAFYMDTAEEIHFSLRGVQRADLETAVLTDTRLPFMTSWEIRYIFRKDLLSITTWYTDDPEVKEFLQEQGISSIEYYHSDEPEMSVKDILEYLDIYEELEIVKKIIE